MMLTHVYASTRLHLPGKEDTYSIHFTIDEYGDYRFVEDNGSITPQTYQLIHLAKEARQVLGLPKKQYVPKAHWCNLAREGNKKYAGIRVLETVYMLTKRVRGSWMNTDHLTSLVNYFEDPEEGYTMAVRWLLTNVPKWDMFFEQEEVQDEDSCVCYNNS